MKVPKKIISVISSVQKHKKIPGFIYNLPDDLRKEIIESQKQSIVIDASLVNSKNFIINNVCKLLGLLNAGGVSQMAMLRIEQAFGNKILIIDRVEFLAPNAYTQIKEFVKYRIPVLLLSSYESFGERFRETKFYRENNFFDYDYEEDKIKF